VRYRWQKSRARGRLRRRRQWVAQQEYAAIDLGTNSCRMLIARPLHPAGGTDFTVVDGFSRVVRLGEGLAQSGQLSKSAIARTLEALAICAGRINARNTAHVRCVATEACRRAANGAQFVTRVARDTGLKLEIIVPEREAELTLTGCAPLIGAGRDRVILLDIGGGSTEIQWVEVPRAGDGNAGPRARDMISLPFGVVTLADEFGTGPMTDTVYQEILKRIRPEIERFSARNEIHDFAAAGRVQMIGTSGTVTTLGAMHLGLPRYDRSRVDGLTIDFQHIRSLSAKLSELDLQGRAKIPCIGPGRADLMLMGCALLSGVIGQWPVGQLRIADRGIREGLLGEMMREHSPGSQRGRTAPSDGAALSAVAAV
jgi:exopolyphosphatase/guanosine-5'-triphosphate,3'-diphosphate pyrophosphatase